VHHATGPEALALIYGQAGTGKTYVMRAVRDIHERQGYEVIGLAPTNAVARIMRNDSFANARALHSELWALDHGRTRWTRRTVVMVNEAAMIDSRNLARLFAHAQASGAKLILTGDDRQLSSIEPGGMFAVLKARFGAATLTEVFRQQKAKDRRASELMAGGNFEDAFESYQSAIHWTDTPGEAMTALADQWAKDSAADSAQSRFVFAYTNRDVNRLNAALHRIQEERGELGPSQRFATKHGAASFAPGDRVQFTETDKAQGIFNGELGAITAIEGTKLTVALDGPGQQRVTFDADTFKGFRHGYAGTIYKGQGRTIGQSYLFHSEHWRAAPSYVALTRHRENTALFVARETAADVGELSWQMARLEDRRAATHFLQSESLPSGAQSRATLKQAFSEAKLILTGKEIPAPVTKRAARPTKTGAAYSKNWP
jgi:ATP-dependent exoDNAse (exonuclease V) alpha subunit